MRISDWSSDVCSSDLVGEAADIVRRRVRAELVEQQEGVEIGQPRPADDAVELDPGAIAGGHRGENALDAPKPGAISGVAIGFADGARKSVVSGKSGSVRVNLGGRRIIKKKKKK